MRFHTLLLAAVFLPAAVQAQSIAIVERDTTTTINPGAAVDFSGASYIYANYIHFNNVAGTDGASNLSLQSNATGITFSGLGSTVVTPPTVPDGTTTANIVAVSPGGTGQGFFFGYSGGDGGFLSSGVLGGKYDLAFSGGGQNALDAGGTFLSTVKILGDYSSASSHTAATYSSDYLVTQNFVYTGGYTYFTVQTTNFQGNNPTIAFSLLGATVGSVPEPATWGMMILGFGMAGAALRRRQKGAAQASYAG